MTDKKIYTKTDPNEYPIIMGPLFDFKKIKCIKKNLGNNNHKPKILKITTKKNCKFPFT